MCQILQSRDISLTTGSQMGPNIMLAGQAMIPAQDGSLPRPLRKGEISMKSLWLRATVLTLWAGLLVGFASTTAAAQYKQTNLTSNKAGKAKHQDSLLQNAWGLVYAPGGPYWISDEWDGWSTLYNAAGVPQKLQVIVPPASGSGPGSPTGIVYNGSNEFQIDSWTSVFLFATLDGTIQGWSSFNPSSTLIGVNNSG